MGQPVVHFEIIGQDAAALQSFYAELFGWTLETFETNTPMSYQVLPREGNVRSDGAGIGGGIGQVPEDGPGWVTFYIEVPDVAAALAEAERLGGKRVSGPEVVVDGLIIGQFDDPEGHRIGVVTNAALAT